jgi:hypothetical protein
MWYRIIVGGLAVLALAALSLVSYGNYTELKNAQARVAQLEQIAQAQQATSDRLEQTAKAQKEALDSLETISIAELNARVDRIEQAVELPAGRLYYHDDASKLDRPTIERAAQSLVERGAQVAVYTVSSDGGPEDFLQRLQQDGLSSGNGVHPTLIAIYVSFSPRYSEIRGGDDWSAAMLTNNNIDTFRKSQLNSGLVAGDYTGGIVNTFAAIDQAILRNP